jgi:hypothetical protein
MSKYLQVRELEIINFIHVHLQQIMTSKMKVLIYSTKILFFSKPTVIIIPYHNRKPRIKMKCTARIN